MFVRKTPNSPRQTTPKDILWTNITVVVEPVGVNTVFNATMDRNFPKPYRTTGITVQMHATSGTTDRGLLVIYYDIDDMIKGEATQALEKSITKGRTRRTFAP